MAGSLVGAVAAALLIGLLGSRAKDRNSIVGVLMPFGLGIGILCLSLYEGRSANRFSLLTGQIVSVTTPDLGWLIGISAAVLVVLVLVWNPLRFDSLDPASAAARGVPSTVISMIFMLLTGLVVSVAVHIIGALLVMALLVTPGRCCDEGRARPACGAAAVRAVRLRLRRRRHQRRSAIAGTLPVSPYITTISFLIYIVCRVIAWSRERAIRNRHRTEQPTPA